MKTYTFRSGWVLTEQEVISRFYWKYWKESYMIEYNFREDLYLLFSALDKYGNFTDEKT